MNPVYGVFLLALGLATNFVSFAEAATPASVVLRPVWRTHSICGASYRSLELRSNSTELEVKRKSLPLGNSEYSVSLPDSLQWSNAVSGPTRNAQSLTISAIPNLGNEVPLPIIKISSESTLNPNAICSWLQGYRTFYQKQTQVGLQTGLLTFSGAPTSVSVTRKIPSLPALNLVTNRSLLTEAAVERVPSPYVDYLIIVQDQYKPQADELAAYRTTQGFRPRVTRVSELPGYNATDPVPAECLGVYDSECFHRPQSIIPGTSYSMVQSLIGMRTLTSVNQSPAKIISLQGLIRAHIRQIKRQYPQLRAVLLIGDPEVLPQSAYAGGVSTGTNLHMGTDLYYMEPFSPLNPNNLEWKRTSAIVVPPQIPCWTGSGATTYRKWCLPGEQQNTSAPVYSALEHPVKRGVPSFPYFTNSNSGGAYPDISQWVVVGRIVTQSKLKPNGIDPAVQNYINKLKYWEVHLPLKQGNSVFTLGGFENWLYEYPDIDNFYANYGGSSKIYASNSYLAQSTGNNAYDPSLSTECPQCAYKSAQEVLQELGTSTHTAWYSVGHGLHFGMWGPFDPVQGAAKPFFYGVSNFYFTDWGNYNGIRGALTRTESGPQNAPTSLLGSSLKLIGHVVANSCDVSSFHRFSNQYEEQVKKYDPNLNQSSFAETLIGMPQAGAINTYLNNNVGWGHHDNVFNRNFANAVHEAWLGCGRFGDAVLGMLANGGANYRWGFHNRVLMGDPLARIAYPAASCRTVSTEVSGAK